MKKKLIALMMVGALSMSMTCAMSVYADEETTEEATEEEASDEESSEVNELTMDMMDAELYEGTWLTFVEQFDLYLPSDWDVLINTLEPEDDSNVVFQAASTDDSGLNVVVTMNSADELNGYGVDDAVAELSASDGYSDVAAAYINDIYACTFDSTSDEGIMIAGVAIFDEEGNMYSIQMAPYTEDTQATIYNVMCSLSYPETEEETETETETVEE